MTAAAAGVLLEREVELALGRGLLQRAGSTGDGVLVLVEGPAGIGKTRLLAELASEARSQDFVVFEARGGELEQELVFGVVRQLFEHALRRAGAADRGRALEGAAALASPVFGLGRRGSGAGAAHAARPADSFLAALHGLYWLVANLAERGPMLLAIDDAQWADGPSLRFIDYLARRLDGLRVVLAAAIRSGEVSAEQALLGAVAAEPDAKVVRPGPLSRAAVAQIVRGGLDARAPGEFCDACHEASGGNPFLVGELIAALAAEGIEPSAERADEVRGLASERIASGVLVRLGRLLSGAVELARAVAVLGTGARLGRCAGLAGLDETKAAAAATALIAAEILAGEHELAFTHPVVRASVYEDLPTVVRAGWHARAARLLADEGAGVDEVAAHLLACDPAGEGWRVALLREAAADAVARGAPDIAVQHLRRALAEPAGDAMAVVLEELAEALLSTTGDAAEAIELLERALTLASEPRERVRLVCRLASTLTLVAGNSPRAVELVRGELARHPDLGEEDRLRLRTELLMSLQAAGFVPPEWAELLAELAALPGNTRVERRALAAVIFDLPNGRADVAADAVRRAFRGGHLLREEGPGSHLFPPTVMVAAFADRFELADKLVADGLREARLRGTRLGQRSALYVRAQMALFRGDLLGAEADAAAILDLSRGGAGSGTGIAFGLGVLAGALVARGALDAAGAALAAHDVPANARNPGIIPYRVGRAAFLGAQGHHEQALEQLMPLVLLERLRPNIVAWASAAPASAELLLALGRRAEATELAEEGLAAASRWGAARPVGIAQRALGLTRPGEQQLELLQAAVATLRQTQARLELARALADLGCALRRRNERTAAREPLREALDLADRCGARPLAERTRAELVIAGGRPRRQRIAGSEALTASERRIATMAAEGLSNREIAQALFITTKTVAHHLTHIYEKLDIAGRQQLTGALASN